jgi:hypothetical protein
MSSDDGDRTCAICKDPVEDAARAAGYCTCHFLHHLHEECVKKAAEVMTMDYNVLPKCPLCKTQYAFDRLYAFSIIPYIRYAWAWLVLIVRFSFASFLGLAWLSFVIFSVSTSMGSQPCTLDALGGCIDEHPWMASVSIILSAVPIFGVIENAERNYASHLNVGWSLAFGTVLAIMAGGILGVASSIQISISNPKMWVLLGFCVACFVTIAENLFSRGLWQRPNADILQRKTKAIVLRRRGIPIVWE